MDLDPRQGLERIGTRGAGRDAFESAATLTAAQAIFDTMREPHVAHFDATQSVGDLHALILGARAAASRKRRGGVRRPRRRPSGSSPNELLEQVVGLGQHLGGRKKHHTEVLRARPLTEP